MPVQIGLLFLALLMLGGCAGQATKPPVPQVLPKISVADVKSKPGDYLGKPVRWGGTIAHVTNLKTKTEFEIVSRPLNSLGRPLATDQTDGRFIAVLPGFLDPAIYKKNREITVRGVISSPISRKIGEFTYTFPVVNADQYYLWPNRIETRPLRRDPFFYDPWPYDPWYCSDPYFRRPCYPWW